MVVLSKKYALLKNTDTKKINHTHPHKAGCFLCQLVAS